MRPPVIGITGRQESVRDDFPETLSHLRSDVFITAYAECVAAAGGVPVWVSRTASPADLAGSLDGFVIAGGQDVDPRLYGAVPGPRSTVLDPERDAFESELVRAAARRGRPVLGICRGAQLINVAFGGTLRADLELGGGESHGFLGYPAAHRSHAVALADHSVLARLLGPTARVNSYHHQCVDTVGMGLVATAHAADGVIEAIERPGADLVGVQWHPEMLAEPDPVFAWLVERCSAGNRSHLGTENPRAIA
jgi:putative glutamine amidotransferase